MYPFLQGQYLNIRVLLLLSESISPLADIYNTENAISFLIQSLQNRATLISKEYSVIPGRRLYLIRVNTLG